MKRPTRPAQPEKRRTTLTLPADSLEHAQRIARARNVNLSTVVSESLSEGLRINAAKEKSEAVLRAYQKAFAGFSEEEMLALNGVVLEEEETSR